MDTAEVHERALAAIRRAAVKESHEVRKLLMDLVQAHEEGVTPENAVIISVRANKAGALVGHLVTTYSFGPSGEPTGFTDWQPLYERPTLVEGGGVQDG